jgi:thioredoxin 1
MLVLFYADWCPLCLIILEYFEKLSENYGQKITIAKINYDDNKELAERYRITGVPAAAAFIDGKLADVRPGFRENDQYIEIVNMIINKNEPETF